MPGLTGWAQVNGRDTLPILEKVALDMVYSTKGTKLHEQNRFCSGLFLTQRRKEVHLTGLTGNFPNYFF